MAKTDRPGKRERKAMQRAYGPGLPFVPMSSGLPPEVEYGAVDDECGREFFGDFQAKLELSIWRPACGYTPQHDELNHLAELIERALKAENYAYSGHIVPRYVGER